MNKDNPAAKAASSLPAQKPDAALEAAREIIDGVNAGRGFHIDWIVRHAAVVASHLLSKESEAVEVERKRCADIVRAARFGEIDSDLRSLIHRIESGDTLSKLRRE